MEISITTDATTMFHLCDLCANCQTAEWLLEGEYYCWKRSWMVPTAEVEDITCGLDRRGGRGDPRGDARRGTVTRGGCDAAPSLSTSITHDGETQYKKTIKRKS